MLIIFNSFWFSSACKDRKQTKFLKETNLTVKHMLPILDFIEENIIGGNTRFVGPYGEKKGIWHYIHIYHLKWSTRCRCRKSILLLFARSSPVFETPQGFLESKQRRPSICRWNILSYVLMVDIRCYLFNVRFIFDLFSYVKSNNILWSKNSLNRSIRHYYTFHCNSVHPLVAL